MPTIKVLRNGQLTLPAKFREILELKQGDFLNAELKDNKIILRPVTIIERKRIKEKAREIFFGLVDKNWEKNKNVDSKKVERIINEVVEEVRKERTPAETKK